MKAYPITTQAEVRRVFFDVYCIRDEYRRKSQNELPADMRCAFVDFVDHLARDGQISESLAQRVTL